MSNGPGAHSPVGGSGIARVIECPGSVWQSQGIEDEESDSAALGTAVHSMIEIGFLTGKDGWELIGDEINGITITKKEADGAQVMLDAVRKAHPDRNQGNFWVERRFHCPTIHPLFFGTSDVVYLEKGYDVDGGQLWVLHIWDYKNGVTLVEHVGSGQGQYYAAGTLEDLNMWAVVDRVVIHIVQPNGFHSEGTVREWETTTEELTVWLEDECIPAIELSLTDAARTMLKSGKHCTFCPARTHHCPQLMLDMEELGIMVDNMEKPGAKPLTNNEVSRLLALMERATIVGKAAKATAYSRIMAGQRIPEWKLVHGKANRLLKPELTMLGLDGAKRTLTVDQAAREKFGEAAFTAPELKSPAQLEALPLGKHFTALWAYSPEAGLRLAPASDKSPEVSVDTKSMFTPVAKGHLKVVA